MCQLRNLIHPLLRPLMRVLRLRSERRLQQLPQPKDAPHVHAPGPDPDRILLFGSGLAIGYGVLSNDLALPGHLARQLSAATGRGVDIDVVADTEFSIRDSATSMSRINLWRYDTIVLTIGVNEALLLTPVQEWRDGLTALLEHMSKQVPKRTHVIVVAVPPLRASDSSTGFSGWFAERHAKTLNRESQAIATEFPRVTFVPFSPAANAEDLWNRTAETYGQWASLLVESLVANLHDLPRTEPGTFDEADRQAALEAMGILDTEADERFDRIALLALQLLDMEYSAIMFVDHNRHWFKAGVNLGETEAPREGSFGDVAIHEPVILVVNDATQDARFSNYHYVKEAPHLRFYAGFPIEAKGGHRVGVISVYDTRPRAWSSHDTEVLRDLALMVERELAAEQDSV